MKNVVKVGRLLRFQVFSEMLSSAQYMSHLQILAINN